MAWDLATQDGELVAQHQDLQVLGRVTAGEQGQQLDGAAQREVGEFGEHRVAFGIGVEKQGRHTTEPVAKGEPQLTHGVSALPHPTGAGGASSGPLLSGRSRKQGRPRDRPCLSLLSRCYGARNVPPQMSEFPKVAGQSTLGAGSGNGEAVENACR